MPNTNDDDARIRNAWEARAKVDPESVLGRSEGVYAVLRVLSKVENPIPADEIAQNTGMKPRNANRILLSLVKHGQAERSQGQYERKDLDGGAVVPSRTPYSYQITSRGISRMEWLKQNKPWER